MTDDDYANPMDTHKVLPNAWVGMTTFFEKEIVTVEESSTSAHVRPAWE